MIENIIQTQSGYRATIDGTEWLIPNAPGNHHWQTVQGAISEGASVTVEQVSLAPLPNLTFAQLLIGLVTEEWITEAEGGGWLVGTLPAPVLAVIATLPSNQQFAAKARAIRPSAVVRADPLVASLAAGESKTSAEIDAFFTTYAAA